MKPEICMGTAQFGLSYGITNAEGQVPESEVAQLLLKASSCGIRWLDTAHAYGDAEAVLGRNLPQGHDFRVISKLSAQPQPAFTAKNLDEWEQAFHISCERIGLESLDVFLLHEAADLRKPGANYLEEWLIGLRSRGLVQRLGVSIYTADDLVGVSHHLLDVVQLPLSLFDQRLLDDGTVGGLRDSGVAIHARSLFLQGLLLTPADQWPGWCGNEIRKHQQALEALALDRNCHLIDLALGFAQAQTDLEAVVLGLCSVQELLRLTTSWEAPSPWQTHEWQSWSVQNPFFLDPRQWPT
jgi:aryl-alcohol dehydrogenase-like predicted oxidoreductase